MTEQHDESKLPRWAQDRLNDLRSQLRTTEGNVRAMRGQLPERMEGRLLLSVYASMDSRRSGPVAVFPLGGYHVRVESGRYRLNLGENRGRLQVMAGGVESDHLIVRPRSCNLIDIDAEESL